MTALIATVLVASFLGSLHCAGMCGVFVAIAVGAAPMASPSIGGRLPRPAWRAHLAAQSAYHGGRLVTYAALGAAAGGLGSALDLAGAAFGLQRTALALAGASMVAFGAILVLRRAGLRVPPAPLPGGLRDALVRGHRRALSLPPLVRAGAIGLMTTLLPCGWLYAFALVAAGTGAPGAGAVTMATFWFGTLPVLAAVGAGARALAGPLRRHVPTVAALAVIAVGAMTVAARLRVPALETSAAARGVVDPAAVLAEPPPCCR
jgi:sulfite exporter TauE/SafE